MLCFDHHVLKCIHVYDLSGLSDAASRGVVPVDKSLL
jgi:hypothetical protein